VVRAGLTDGPKAVSRGGEAFQKLHYIKQMKNTPIRVCAKYAFVGWPSTENRRTSFSIIYTLIIIPESNLNYCIETRRYGKFNHRYNVSYSLPYIFGCGEFY
jgi:hypothetical protein